MPSRFARSSPSSPLSPYASSIHTVGFHRRETVVGVRCDHRPDSLYGASKCFVEDLARYYFDKFGIESVCLRINSCFPEPVDRRMLGTWLSYRDCVELVRRSLLAPRVGFTVVYGISDNSEAFVTNEGAQHIGFRPRDSAEVFRRKVEAATSRPIQESPLGVCVSPYRPLARREYPGIEGVTPSNEGKMPSVPALPARSSPPMPTFEKP